MDIDSKKYELTSLAQAKLTSASAWGGQLKWNCLPASLSILQETRVIWPGAHVVIGHICFAGEPSMTPQYGAALMQFLAKPCAEPAFHAWIDLDTSDFLDTVAPLLAPAGSVTSTRRFVDQQAAADDAIVYSSLISDTNEVMQFYSTLQNARLAK
jgi:hypothetical protein